MNTYLYVDHKDGGTSTLIHAPDILTADKKFFDDFGIKVEKCSHIGVSIQFDVEKEIKK